MNGEEFLPFEAPLRPLPLPALSLASALLAASYPFALWCAWRPWGTNEAWMVAWPILTALIVVGLVAIAALRFVRPENRASAQQLLILALVSAAGAVAALRAADMVSRREEERFVERSGPLVVAIERFARERGRAPARLEALVPDFLARVPPTGVGVCPAYRLERGPSDWELVLPRVPGQTGERLVHPASGEPVHGPDDRRIGSWWALHISE